MAKIVVTGGSGYLGSCASALFVERGHDVVVLDRVEPPDRLSDRVTYHSIDLTHRDHTHQLFSKLGKIDGILHFAALALVSESCREPERYLRENSLSTLSVASAAKEHRISNFVFSSSCSVYGTPKETPIAENCPLKPISPYGESKRISEGILEKFGTFGGLRVLALRYFNPAGSVLGGAFGEAHDPETHLIPNVVNSLTRKEPITLFGSDYPTEDGTCIRDFIHVEDLIDAHWAGLEYLEKQNKPGFEVMNVGTGSGASVKQVIQTAERVLNLKGNISIEPPRPGDPPKLVASPNQAQARLGWKAKHGLEQMIESHHRFALEK